MEYLFNEIDSILQGFHSIPLQELPVEPQMSRFDNKYLFSSILLPELISKMTKHYDVLETGEHRILNYQSNYFDTNRLDMYLAHHNGKMNRFKIRFREYLESGDKFLEVKHKNNKGLTSKERIPIVNPDLNHPVHSKFIDLNSSYKTESLNPSLQTNYKRMTFVNKNQNKRITIDSYLNYAYANYNLLIPGIAVAEIKNLDRNPSSRFNRILDSYGIKKCSFSKYAIGIAMLNNQIKKNRFKEKLSQINKLQDEFDKHFNIKHAQS